jgi:UDP-galactopyranose mutase
VARVVVVGGGFAGTAAAARLAKLGHGVTLVERLPHLGGALGFVERDGYRWDRGPSYTALPAVVRDLFRKSGRPLERELELVPVQPMREHRWPDGTTLPMPSGSRAAQLDAVDQALGPGLGTRWVDYVHAYAETWDVLRRGYLERPYDPEHPDPATRAVLRRRTSLRSAVARALPDERLRDVALLPAVLGGHQPRDVPAWTGMWAYVEQNFGTWTVPGGLGALAEAMTRRLEQRGVDVRLGTTVLDVLTAGHRATGVQTTEGVLDADVVVVSVDLRHLPLLAPFVDQTMPAIPPVVCHVGLAGELPDLPHEVVLHGDPLLVVRTGGVAPPGQRAWTVLARGRLGEDVLLAMARAGLDVREHVQVRVDRSPVDLVRELGGSPYGTLWQGRATVRRKLGRLPWEGLHAVGASTAAVAELPLVGLTAATVAERVGPAAR